MSSLFSSRHLGRLSTFGVLALLLIAGCGDDGDDGQTPIIESQDASEEQCPGGGTVIITGLDTEGDGEINADHESYTETVLCDGTDGDPGDDGAPGDDGGDGDTVGLVSTSAEDPGDNCEVGGIRVETGFDTTGDGEIDDVEDVNYVCSAPSCASGQPLDFEVHADQLPDELIVGMTYDLDVTTSATDLDVDVLNAGVASTDIDAEYNADEETISLTANSGTDVTDLAILATDGCDLTTTTVRFGPLDDGMVDLHVAHLIPGAGDVEIVDTDTGDVIADVDELDVISSFNAVEVPWGTYNLEVLDEDGDSLGVFNDVELEPLNTYMAYAYLDDGEFALGLMESDVEDPADDDFRVRGVHAADSGPDVDIYAIDPATGDETLLFEDLGFGDFSDQVDLPEAPNSYLAADTTGDGDPDTTYVSTYELFEEGTNFEVFAYFDGDDDDELWLLTFDYDATTNNSVNLHDPDELATSELHVAHLFPGAGDVEIFVAGADYDEDDPIADVDELDVISDFNAVDIDEGTYDLEVVSTDGDLLGSFDDIMIAPFTAYMAYAYNDGDGLALGIMQTNKEEPADDETRIRATHLATNGPDVGIYAIDEDDNMTLLAEDLAFESSTDQVDLDEFEDSFLGIDLTGDGVVDAEFESTEGLFEGESNFEIFAYFDQGNLWLLTFNYETFTSASVNLHSSVDFTDIYAGHFFEGAGPVRAFASGDDPQFANPIFELSENTYDGPFDIAEADQELEFYDADDTNLGSTGSFTVDADNPEALLVFDDGGLSHDFLPLEDSDVPDDEFRARAHHFAGGFGTVDVYADEEGVQSLLIENLGLLDTIGPATFPANEDASLAIDSDQDGTADLLFETTEGAFEDGADLEVFAFAISGDLFVGTFDYGDESFALHPLLDNLVSFTSSPQIEIPINGQDSDVITVSDCDTVAYIDMDIEFYTNWRGEFTIYLENPAGDEIPLKSRFGGSTNDIIGNFNRTLNPESGFSGVSGVQPISYFNGSQGNGDWTITVVDETTWDEDPFLESWGLNFICSD